MCDVKYTDTYRIFDEPMTCQREGVHSRHQIWTDDVRAEWSPGGGSSSRRPINEEDLAEWNSDYLCTKCGAREWWTWTEDLHVVKDWCFTCNFWEAIRRETTDKDVVIEGRHYQIGPVDSHLGGFGGRRFNIEFFDGRRVSTNNLWTQGEIPVEWIDAFPDNARYFTPESK